MTNREAIEVIKNDMQVQLISGNNEWEMKYNQKILQAIVLAIKALEKEAEYEEEHGEDK